MFITPGFPSDEEDSQCIPALHLYAKALSESGAQVSIIALQYPYRSEPYQWNGISVYPMNGANKKWKQLMISNKALSAVKKIHKSAPIDVVHSFWLHRTTLTAEKIAKGLKLPLLATAMGQEMRYPTRLFDRWTKASFPIVSLCDFQADALRKQGLVPEKIIPWGLEKTRSAAKDIDLICVGSLIQLKNPKYFLELCAKLKENLPDFKARMIGEGPLENFLKHEIESMGLKDNVQLDGSLSYPETQALIARSKVLVHASDFEGFGMTIIEAKAVETLVLATPVGIAKSLEIPHLIGDVQLDVAMLQMLLKSDRPAAELFSIADTVQSYQSIYESVSKEKASGS